MNWSGKLAFGAACAVIGAVGSLAVQDRPAGAQNFGGMGGGPLHVASSSTGSVSHAWSIDPRTSLVIHCVSTGPKAEFVCDSQPLPGMARP